MKDHPKPTKEQMEAAEKVAQSSDHCEGGPVAEGYGDGCDCCDRYIGIQAEHIAQAFARREAQARKEQHEADVAALKSVHVPSKEARIKDTKMELTGIGADIFRKNALSALEATKPKDL